MTDHAKASALPPALTTWVEELRIALGRSPDRRRTARTHVERLVAARDGLLAALGPPQELGARRLVADRDLTVDLFAWVPGVMVPAHDHRTWAVLGSLSGVERNTLYRQDGPRLTPMEIVDVQPGRVVELHEDVIHGLDNPVEAFCVAVHVYGTALDAEPRRTWGPHADRERPLDPSLIQWVGAELDRLERLDEAPYTLAAGRRAMRAIGRTLERCSRIAGRPGVTTDGVAYNDAGSGPPVVLVHGVGFDRVSWSPLVDVLSDTYRCVALDLPGHGESTVPCRDLESAVAAIGDVVSTLQLDRPLLVGHAEGGLVARAYAAAREAAAVVQVGPPTPLDVSELHACASELRGPAFRATFGRIERAFDYAAIPPERRAFAQARCSPRRETVLALWSFLLEQPPELALRDLAARTLEGRTPSFTWPHPGHFPHLVDPARFATWLRLLARDAHATPASPSASST